MPENDTEKMREYIMDMVDQDTAPNKMTPREAIEFLGALGADIDGRIESLKEENDL
jgi:hypothetical protein